MAGEAAAAMLAVQAVQLLLSSFETNLAFTAFSCPLTTSTDTIASTSFDYIIVGGGSAGSVLANRLSACSNVNVLLLEAGDCPPLESVCSGYFTLQPQSAYDYNMTSVNDDYAAQNLQGSTVGLTTGKMLGGSSSLHHTIHVRGAVSDYDRWNDNSWTYEALLPYFKKSENVVDEVIINDYPDYVGTGGPITLKRQLSSKNAGIIDAFVELGLKHLNNSNANITLGVVEPQLTIGTDNLRQSGLVSYIYPVKDRSNLYVLTGATVSKVNFDSNNVAIGVTYTYGDTSYTVNASSEVILAAGAIITPQLLMLSGVGPSDHLTEKGITVVSNLTGVGQNLQDHVSATVLIALEEDTSTAASASPFDFPVPVTCAYGHLTNASANYAEYQSINLVFPHDSSGLLQLCMNVFKYNQTICDGMYEANVGRTVLWAIPNALHPVSSGQVLLNTTSIEDQPLVQLALLSNSTDLVNLGLYVANIFSLVNTTYFKSVGAEIVDFGLCSDETLYSTEYYQCYAKEMSSTMWHYSGTAAIGSVVDSNLLVKGVSNLRVVDASVFPAVPGGNINAAVVAVAEKIADTIVSGLDTCTTA